MRNITAISQQENGCVDFHSILAVKASGAILHGAGTSSAPFQKDTADKNFLSYYLKSAATSGTARGMYMRLYVTGGAGGEAIRSFTTVESNTPADTVNGIHASLGFGASAGNITGLGTAGRFTFHVPASRTINGTCAAVQAEIYGDGASGAIGGVMSFVRMIVDGHTDLKGSMDSNGFLFDIQGLTSGSTKLFLVGAPSTLAASLKVRVGSTTYYLPLYSAQA